MSLALFFAQRVSNASTSVGLSLFNYQDDARSNKHKINRDVNFDVRVIVHP